MFEETKEIVQKYGLPAGDLNDLPSSDLRFPDGSHFRIECPTVNTVEAAAAILERAEKNGIVVNRITETYGLFRHTAAEIKEYVKVCHDYGAELIMSTGPRATYDTGATVLSAQGVRVGYRLRGMDQVLRAIEDLKRGYELGVRGFLVYDEGLLWLLGKMRRGGDFPEDTHFKTSAHLGHCNPASMKVLEEFGTDSFNPIRDLQLPMIAAIRSAGSIPLDLHMDNPPGSGGFIRVYEGPEIVRIAAPVYCKTGNSVVAGHGQLTSASDGRKMADQATIVLEMIHKYYPDFKQTPKGDANLKIPVV